MLNLIRRLLSKSKSQGSRNHEGSYERSGGYSISAAGLLADQGMLAIVDGQPTHAYAKTHKHDVDMMLRCCKAEEDVYWAQEGDGPRLAPAPYYFERAAILSRKAHDYSGEVAICERWVAMAHDFKERMAQNPETSIADVTKGPPSRGIFERLPKAQALLAKQQENI